VSHRIGIGIPAGKLTTTMVPFAGSPHRIMSSGFALRWGKLDSQALALDMAELSRCSNAKTTPRCERPFGNGWASAANRA